MTHDIQEPSRKPSSRVTQFVLRALVLVGGSLTLAGCPLGTDLEDADLQHDVRYSKVCADAIFENNCSGPLCHTPESGVVHGGIDLFSPGLPERLYNQPASYKNVAVNASNCPTTSPELLANSSNPSASLFLTKIYGVGYACGEGMPKPYPLLALEPEELECLTDYVNAVITAGDAQ